MESNLYAVLEKRIEHMEYRIKLLAEIADSKRHPFTYMILESNLTEPQVRAIFDLMDRATKTIRNGEPMSRNEFEDRVYNIVQNRRGDYHFVDDIISSLKDEGRWAEVYEQLKKSDASSE
jgi:hypothetical protein